MQRDLALIGAGYWGKNLARNFNAIGALHTICDAFQGTLEKYTEGYESVQRETNANKVFANKDITKIAIAAPAVMHYPLAKQAILAGKDVYVEKPLCLDLNDAEELVNLANEHNRILMVGHLLQYHPYIQKLQSMIVNGELGKIYYITSNRLNLGKIRKEENSLWSFAPHDLSVVLSLTGNRLPESVRCSGGDYLTDGVCDTTLTTLHFEEKVKAHVYVSWLNPFKEQKLTVVGSKGMVVFDDTKPWNEKLQLYKDYLKWGEGNMPSPVKNPPEAVLVPEAEPLKAECQHFIESCEKRTKPRTDGEEGLRVLKVLQAAQKSLISDGERVNPASSGKQDAKSYFVHPTAIVDVGAEIGRGTKVWHFAHVMKGARIGERCILGQNVNVDGGTVIGNNVKIQNNVSIYTGVTLEDDVFMGPSCVLTNVTNPRSQVLRHSLYEKTLIKRGATIGANATIVCGTTIGRYALIGAGSVVTKDVPDYALIVGNPGKQIGWVSRHGQLLKDVMDGKEVTCPETGYRYLLKGGILKCLDLDEEAHLPESLSKGEKTYDEFKVKSK